MRALALLTPTLTLFACASDGAEFDDVALADELWSAVSGYDGWAQPPEWPGVQPSVDGTHGPYVQVWWNTLAEGSANSAAADGSILVKEAYDDDAGATDRGTLSVMYKVEGYDPDNGDWFWAQYDSAGTNTLKGSVSGCYGCHGTGDDYRRVLVDTPPTGG